MSTSAIVPGVFGSYAIPMRNFPASAKWSPILRAIKSCATQAACTGRGGFEEMVVRARQAGFSAKLSMVNAGINQMIAYRGDRKTYGRLDHWAKPAESLRRGAGDCEDFAILKMAALARAGVPLETMSLVILRDNGHRVFHAVLAVNTSSGAFILDNVRNTVVMDTTLPDYQPLYSLSAGRAYIHGRKAGGASKVADADLDMTTIAPGEGRAYGG